MKYVLFIWFLNGMAISTATFEDLKACQYAGNAWHIRQESTDWICVPMRTEPSQNEELVEPN